MTMTLDEAVDILKNKKDHWSHEIDDAKDVCMKAAFFIIQMPVTFKRDLMNELLTKPGCIGGNCKFNNFGFNTCMRVGSNRTTCMPMEEACEYYEEVK